MPMPDYRFSGLSKIVVQGSRVLRVRSLAPDHADFLVRGFGRRVRIRDYRRRTLRHLDAFLDGTNTGKFAAVFSEPATSTLLARSAQQVNIVLHDAEAGRPHTLLWIAAGLRERSPGTEYLFRLVESAGDGCFAAVALVNLRTRSRGWPVVDTGMKCGAPRRSVLTVA